MRAVPPNTPGIYPRERTNADAWGFCAIVRYNLLLRQIVTTRSNELAFLVRISRQNKNGHRARSTLDEELEWLGRRRAELESLLA